MTSILGEKKEKFYLCKKCDYHTSDKSKYNRHLLTDKHNTPKYSLKGDKKEIKRG